MFVALGNEYEPDLKAKAHNAMVVCKWLAHVTKDDNTELGRHRAAVLWGLSYMHTVFSTAPFRLSDEQTVAVVRAGRVVLASWRVLLTDAEAKGLARWHMVPKVHLFQHLLVSIEVTKRNPASHWVFADEHNIGMVKKMARGSMHASTLSQSALDALHLFFTFSAEGRTVAMRAEVEDRDGRA